MSDEEGNATVGLFKTLKPEALAEAPAPTVDELRRAMDRTSEHLRKAQAAPRPTPSDPRLRYR